MSTMCQRQNDPAKILSGSAAANAAAAYWLQDGPFQSGEFLTCLFFVPYAQLSFSIATAGWCIAAHGHLIWLIYAMPRWAQFKY